MAQMVGRFGPIARMVEWIGLSAVLAIALGVLNATSMTVRERTREVAMLKSFGFSSGQIILETSFENAITAVVGGTLGVAVAAACIDQLRGFVPSLGPLMSFGLPLPVIAASLAVAAGIGLTAGILPAVRATRSTVLDGLRRTA